jgi:hypothetical protein
MKRDQSIKKEVQNFFREKAANKDGWIAALARLAVLKKSGRPRGSSNESLAARVRELKVGRTWSEVAEILNEETGVYRTASAYRILLARS